MRVFDFLFGKKKKEIGNEAEKIVTLDELIKILKDKEDVDVLRESTYFICLKVLSEAVGKLPLKAYRKTENGGKEEVEHEALYVLSKRPNKFQSASVFWATVEMCRNHFGNAYVYLEHDRRGVLKNMYILDNSKMRVFVDNMGYLGGINEVL